MNFAAFEGWLDIVPGRKGKELRHPKGPRSTGAAPLCQEMAFKVVWLESAPDVSMGMCSNHVQVSGDPKAKAGDAEKATVVI